MLLAIDTSTRWLGLALYDGSVVQAEMSWHSQNHHTTELAPAIQTLMAHAGVKISDVQAVAVALGPGSFTGLRIGLAVAKGLAFSRWLPLVGVPSLDVVAAGQPLGPLPMAAVLQAGRTRLAVGWYAVSQDEWQAQSAPQVMTVEELSASIRKPTLVCGELSAEQRKRLARRWKKIHLTSPAMSVRRPAVLAEQGWQRWQDGQTADLSTLAPIYLHYGNPIPD